MLPIKVKKQDLLKTLKLNKEKHRAIFEEALDGYQKKAIELLEKNLNIARAGRKFKLYIQLTQPVDQTADYDRVIGMLEMTLEKVIALEEEDYRAYVLDEWHWKNNFLTANSTYSSTAAAFLAK